MVATLFDVQEHLRWRGTISTKQVGAMLPLSQKNQKACTVYVVFAPCLGIHVFLRLVVTQQLVFFTQDDYSRALLKITTQEHY